MSLAEIKDEVTRLTPAERDELALQLKVLRELETPGLLAEITAAHAAAECGAGEIDREEMLARLRAFGRVLG